MTTPAISLLALFIVLNAADVFTTERAIRRGNREGNPVGAWLMAKLGRSAAYGIKMVVMTAIGAAFALNYWPVLGLLCAGLCWVVWHNWRAVK